MSRLRFSEYVPATSTEALRQLRGLPAAWGQAVAETEVDALRGRAEGVSLALRRRGREREAAELRRLTSVLERTDELHRHASDLETIAGLCRALEAFAPEAEPALVEGSLAWAQLVAGTNGHGAAFRETALLRNRAFRLLASTLARRERELARVPR